MGLFEQQQRFMAHIRDPAQNPPPADVPPQRMAVYSELFFNNIEGFLASAFPVLKSLYPPALWLKRVRRFYADYDCQSPLFLEISDAFLDYLDSPAFSAFAEEPLFIRELAHYEWLELACDRAIENGKALKGIIADTPLRLSNAAAVAAYHWPVQDISRQYQPQAPLTEPLLLLVHRDASEKVCFARLNPALASILALIEAGPGITPAKLVGALAHTLAQSPEQLMVFLLDTLSELANKRVLFAC